jgi:hypothetical protein
MTNYGVARQASIEDIFNNRAIRLFCEAQGDTGWREQNTV